jgi:Tat protein translocase TatB subunit
MGFPGGGEFLAIFVVALVVFGPQRLPEIARQIGDAMGKLRGMQATVKREINDAMNLNPITGSQIGSQTDFSSSAPSYAEYGMDEPPPLPAPSRSESIEPPSGSFN